MDTRTCKMANQDLIKEWLESHDEDSDFIRVRVKGLPPVHGFKSMVSRDDVNKAIERAIRVQDVNPSAPLVMGVDISREGDDQNALICRKGPKVSEDILVWDERDLMRTAAIIAKEINRRHPDIVFIDANGMGAGVLDRLVQLGYDNVVGIKVGEKADDPKTYFNKRAECWHRLAQWVKDADLPDEKQCRYSDRLRDELCGPEYYFNRRELLQLESKKEMELRGVSSPDIADALSLTFAYKTPTKSSDEGADTEPEVV